MENLDKIKYEQAIARVKRIKGFYTHALVYVVINIMLVIVNIQNMDAGENYFQFKNFQTLFFWGIGLLAHGLSVFVPNIIMGKDWEEKKIKQFMEEEKKQVWK
jgi:uncharacterized integral membrane protein